MHEHDLGWQFPVGRPLRRGEDKSVRSVRSGFAPITKACLFFFCLETTFVRNHGRRGNKGFGSAIVSLIGVRCDRSYLHPDPTGQLARGRVLPSHRYPASAIGRLLTTIELSAILSYVLDGLSEFL